MSRMLQAFGRVAAIVTGAIVVWVAPVQAQNCAPFTDVLASSGFCGNIQWLFNRGITQGCTATQYCPANFVRRDQIAAFLNRLADDLFPLDCAPGQVMKWNGTAWACAGDAAGPANAFVQAGNAFGMAAVLGTNDAQPVEIEAGNARVMRYEPNAISPNVIGGSPANNATAGVRGATIAGGGVPPGADPGPGLPEQAPNQVTDPYGTVGGGYNNVAGNENASFVDAPAATVGGGAINTASGAFSVVAGGHNNVASGAASFIGGGNYNTATGGGSVIAGGGTNVASQTWSTVAGGASNTASGQYSMVAGGSLNTASGAHSFAAGHRAQAKSQGQFIWSDSIQTEYPPSTIVLPNNFFGVRATGGVGFVVAINAFSGLPTQFCDFLAGYSSWNCTSDRDAKENFVAADGEDILARLVAMPLFSWNFKGADPRLRMLGPTAQDFAAAFGLGAADKTTIASGNLDGVALAAIKGLNAKLEARLAARDAELEALRAEVAEMRTLRAEMAGLRALLSERLANAVR